MSQFRPHPKGPTKKQYNAQCNTMFVNMLKWRKEHPMAEVRIQFNYPPKVCMIAPISEALRKNIVSANDHGLALMKFMWPNWDDPKEPTVNMYRFTLEHIPPPKRPPPTPCPYCGQKIKVGGFFNHRDAEKDNSDVTPGAIALCLHCAGISVFKDDLSMRQQTPEEFAALPPDLRHALSVAIETCKANPMPVNQKRK